MTISTVLYVTCILMALGAAAIFLVGGKRTEDEETDVILHGIVPLIAACSYFAMATHQGAIPLPLGAEGATRDFYFARYLDWAFTTPILLYALYTTSVHRAHRRHGAMFGLLAADALMILTALFFGASETPWVKWTWYAISSAAFVAVYYVIWGPLRAETRHERDDVRATYLRNASILSVLWFVYPLILAAGTDGLRIISPVATAAAIAVLDLTAKVAFGLLAVRARARIVERDLAEGERAKTALDTSHRPLAAE